MEKTYTYENAVIHIFIPEETNLHIQKATERFMKKVIAERKMNNGDNNQSSTIREK